MNSSVNRSTPSIDKKPSKAKRVLIPVMIIIIGISILIFLAIMAPKPQKKQIVHKAPLVEVLEVSQGDIIFEIESQGSISPRTETTLVSEVSGQIKNVSDKFVVGGFFKKGEQLLEIDPISYEVALLQAQARLDGAKAKLVEEKARGKQAEKEWSLTGRSKKNAPILALRKPQLQQAEADVKAAEADVKGAQIKLNRTKITVPYDAMVKAKMVDIGQYVSTGTQLAMTFAVDYAEIRLPIKEQDLAYINIPALGQINQKGSQIELSTFQAGKVKKWSTFVTRSEGVVDATSRVNYIVAQINDPYGVSSGNISVEPIRMGTFVKAKIMGIETTNVITIPRKAVRGSNEIYLIDENRKLKLTQVEVLRSDSKNIYISSGLKEGDKVILTKLATVVNGMNLRLKGDPVETPNDNDRNDVKPVQADSVLSNETRAASETLRDENQGKEANDKSKKSAEDKTAVQDEGSL